MGKHALSVKHGKTCNKCQARPGQHAKSTKCGKILKQKQTHFCQTTVLPGSYSPSLFGSLGNVLVLRLRRLRGPSGPGDENGCLYRLEDLMNLLRTPPSANGTSKMVQATHMISRILVTRPKACVNSKRKKTFHNGPWVQSQAIFRRFTKIYEDLRRFLKILRILSTGCSKVSDHFPKVYED